MAGWGPGGPEAGLSQVSLFDFSAGATALCWNPLFVPLVSVNLDGLLILTNIALGLFKLNFFSLRKKKNPIPQLPVTVRGCHGRGRAKGECPGEPVALSPGPGLWPACSAPFGGASGALGQESGRTEADPPARWCRGLGPRVRKEKSEETTRQLRAKSNNRKRYLGACLAAQGCPQSPPCLCRGPTCSDRPAPAPCRRLPGRLATAPLPSPPPTLMPVSGWPRPQPTSCQAPLGGTGRSQKQPWKTLLG